MMIEIKNTISFAYPIGSAKPTIGEMANFAKALDSNPVDIDTIYRIGEEKAVFVRYKNEASMRYALMHNPEHLTFKYDNGRTVQVRMSVAGGLAEYVRVYDLPPEVPDAELELELGKYGKIKRVIREKFPAELCLDIYTGVRGVHMEVEREVPSSLYFAGRKGNIFYSGNKNKCFICHDAGHRMNACPKRKARQQLQPDAARMVKEKRSKNGNTYADAVTSDSSSDGSKLEAENDNAGDQDEHVMETGEASLTNGMQGPGKQQENIQEEYMISSGDEISEDKTQASYKDNTFYRIALKIKRRQDEEKEKKRLQDKKGKGTKKHYK